MEAKQADDRKADLLRQQAEAASSGPVPAAGTVPASLSSLASALPPMAAVESLSAGLRSTAGVAPEHQATSTAVLQLVAALHQMLGQGPPQQPPPPTEAAADSGGAPADDDMDVVHEIDASAFDPDELAEWAKAGRKGKLKATIKAHTKRPRTTQAAATPTSAADARK